MDVDTDQDEEEFVLTYVDREKIAELLLRYQNLSSDSPLSSVTRCFSIDPGSSNFLAELFQELENVAVDDLTREGTARNFANFLIDLAGSVPEVVLLNINSLLPHLDGECFSLRNAILTVLAELVERRLQGEGLSDDEKITRDSFLQHMEEHIHDKNAFVRAKVLQLWMKLVESKALPVSRLKEVLPLIVGRLADKGSTVRKAAVHFLTTALKGNPFMAEFKLDEVKTKYEAEKAKLEEMLDAHREDEDAETEIIRQRHVVQYFEAARSFVEQFLAVLPQVTAMLRLQQASDVLEAIDFVITCNEFGIPGAKPAFWECCRLIWSKEQPIKDAVVLAVQRLYLSSDDPDEKTSSLSTAKNLISLAADADLSQLTSLEEIVCELFKRQLLSPTACRHLWEHFSMRSASGNKYEESKAALKLLGMVAKAEKSVIRDNLDILVEFGLGEKAATDFELAADACYVLEKLSLMPKAKAEEALKMEPCRFKDDHNLFTRLQVLIVDGYSRLDDTMWIPMAERAMRVIFGLANHPNDIAATILKDMLAKWNDGINEDGVNGRLLRLLSLIGQTALQSFINLDVSVCRELKRRALLVEEKRIKQVSDARRAKLHASPPSTVAGGGKRKLPIKTPRSKVSTVSALTPTIDVDDELNAMVGATADDQEYEFVNQLCEGELLSEQLILGQLSKLVLLVCQNPHKYQNEEIQTAAALALSKLMLVSSKFAEANIQLFFTLMDRSEWATVRANLVIAVGDLSFRFPNLVEPWTATVYQRLHDGDLNVRLNCLLILNHLILNDMIKPKGFVADIALCTLDGSGHISNLAKKFFAEYSEKGNSLYNLLPDIISRLSDPGSKLDFDQFKSILKFLFSLIRKERQFEGLVEKLCQRFVLANSQEQWCRLSYCLTLPTYNDRCVKKLLENIKCFGTKLGDDGIYCDFITIINASKKACKQESKELLDELEEKIMSLHKKYDINGGGRSAGECMDVDIKPCRESAKTPRRRRVTIDSPEASTSKGRASQRTKSVRRSDE